MLTHWFEAKTKWQTFSRRHFQMHFLEHENFCTLINISLQCVLKGLIGKMSTLVQVKAWCQTGDKPLPELMLTILRFHMGLTRPKCIYPMVSSSDNWTDFSFHLICISYELIRQQTTGHNIYEGIHLQHSTCTNHTHWQPLPSTQHMH